MKNLRVYDPSTSTLNVRWDHAEGNPRQYKLFYAPTAGGQEEMVIIFCEKYMLNKTIELLKSGVNGVILFTFFLRKFMFTKLDRK